MKYPAILTALGLGSALLAFGAQAEGPPGHPARHRAFERLHAADTNSDDMISRDVAAALPRLAKDYDALDANRGGQLTRGDLLKRYPALEAWLRGEAAAQH